MAQLYGGAIRESLEQKWLIAAAELKEAEAEAERRRADGIQFFMLKVGSRPLDQDVRLTRALRNILGDRLRLCADANGAWTRPQAAKYLNDVADCDLVYLEQPLASDKLDDAAELAASVSTPLSLDECVASTEDIRVAWAARATCGAVIKSSKFGGLWQSLQAGTACEALKLKVALATPMAESSIGTAAALQVSAVLPHVEWEIAPSSDYLAEDLVEVPIRHAAGRLPVPSGPGVGVQVDRRLVDRFRLDR